MTKNLLLLTCASGALSLVAGVGQAAAATAAAQAAATDQATASVTELVVTAEKRETSLQRVPVAVSVFTGAQRDAIGINTVADVTNFAPGFSYDPANVHAYIRGIGRQSVNVTDDQRVANYEDEFYVYSPYGLDKSSLFLSQEQIERGPQNVGGREAPGGSIDMISVRPTDHPYGEMRVNVGNFGTYGIEGAFSTQIAPGLDVRIAGYDHDQNDGFYKNLGGGKSEGNVDHEWYLEGQVDWKPNDKFEFWARAFTSAWNNRGDAGSRVGFANGSFDETNLTDANAYVGGGLFVNPNYGYSALHGGNPTAAAAVAAGGPDIQPISATLLNGNVLDNPGMTNPYNFISPLERDVKLNGYDDFNYIATYHAPGFDIKYNGGIQGYNYDLTYDGTDTGVSQFTLPGSLTPTNAFVNTVLNHAFGGGPFPGCASCGFPSAAFPHGSPLPAGQTLPGPSNLVINPLIQSNYIEDDWWTAHDLTFESTTDGPLQWAAGGFFYFQHYNQPYQVNDPQQPQLTHPDYVLPGAILGPAATCPIPAAPGVGLCGFTPGVAAPLNPNNTILYADYKFNVETISGYGQLSYKINDQWNISGNVRYSWDDKWGVENTRTIVYSSAVIDGLSPFFGNNTPSLDFTPSFVCLTGTANTAAHPTNCTTGPLAPGVKSAGVILPNGYAQRQLAITDSEVTGNAKVEFTPTPDILAYASYGRGYASPSFNAGIVSAAPEVAPEFLNSYEIGYKQSFGRNLLINMALFYYDYDNFQQPISINNAGVVQGEFVNVPKARSDGFEMEGYWTPVRDLSITLSYSFNDTAVLTGCSGKISPSGVPGVVPGVLTPNPGTLCLLDTNDPAARALGANPVPGQIFNATTNPGVEQSVKGDPLPDAPRNKIALSAAYTFHYDPGDLTLSADYVWRDKQDGAIFNRWYDNAPAWSDVDIRALWKGPNDRYEVVGFVKNVFNTLQYTVASGGVGLLGNSFSSTTAANGLIQQNLFELNPPRTYGVEVRYKFF
jgi:iron complex outermembrane recepter protein